MSYNDAGCVTYLTRNTKTNISSLSLSWNGEYQLTQVEAVDPNDNYNYIYYTYDSLGRKTSRMDNDTWEYYIYDGMNLVADYDAYNGRITRTYSYGPGVDNIQSMTIYDEYGGSETYYYVKDASNTVHVLVDEDGLIVEYYYYDAFGNLMKMRDVNYNLITESVYGNRFLFQGREYDYDTALYYFRARWYEPETGRWLSPDPIGISGGLNLYTFCGNDPVNFVDPSGLDVWRSDRPIEEENCSYIPDWIENRVYTHSSINIGDYKSGNYLKFGFYPADEKNNFVNRSFFTGVTGIIKIDKYSEGKGKSKKTDNEVVNGPILETDDKIDNQLINMLIDMAENDYTLFYTPLFYNCHWFSALIYNRACYLTIQ